MSNLNPDKMIEVQLIANKVNFKKTFKKKVFLDETDLHSAIKILYAFEDEAREGLGLPIIKTREDEKKYKYVTLEYSYNVKKRDLEEFNESDLWPIFESWTRGETDLYDHYCH